MRLLGSSSYTAAMSKNNLFQAKILELQARIDFGHNPSAVPPQVRYRSPLVPSESGAVTYRFEKTPRPASARVHNSGAVTARDRDLPVSSRRAAEPSRPVGVSKLMLVAKDGAPARRKGGVLAPATATANPRSVDRVFRELRRTQQPPQPPPDSARRSAHYRRGADAAGDDEGESAAVEAAIQALEADAREGRLTKSSPMTVEMVYCVDSAQRSLAVKLRPERYRQAAQVRL